MSKTSVAGGFFATVLVLAAIAAGFWTLDRGSTKSTDETPAPSRSASELTAATLEPEGPSDSRGFLYGQIETKDGTSYEGRLRFGGSQEAFWDDLFNGVKSENPWAKYVPNERLQGERRPITVLGLEVGENRSPLPLARPCQVRFGDVARIDSEGRHVRVTLKSGTVLDFDRLEAGDFDDGVRVWDVRRGTVDLEPLAIRAIELRATPPLADLPRRLRGTVQTKQGELHGFLAWNRDQSLATDELRGRTADGRVALPLGTIRTLVRRSPTKTEATLTDGRAMAFVEHHERGLGQRNITVSDSRFGRVHVAWSSCERVEIEAPGASVATSGPAYDDFSSGHPLAARVTTRDGRTLAGRLVFDLDESETTDTLDASANGIDYSIPFALIASLTPPRVEGKKALPARVDLRSGTTLELGPTGDLGSNNGGLLVFAATDEATRSASVTYLAWGEVARLELDPPPPR